MSRQVITRSTAVRINGRVLSNGDFGVVIIDHDTDDMRLLSTHGDYDDAVRALAQRILKNGDGLLEHGCTLDLVHNTNGTLDLPQWTLVQAAG